VTRLAGATVVVTRPAAQAAAFAAMLEAAGAAALKIPALEIEPVEIDPRAVDRLLRDDYDWAIFTSANSVTHAPERLRPPGHARVAAIGRGTARALREHGIGVDAFPEGRSDSEGLLALTPFARIRGRRVLILKGEGGRPYLREELARRGAVVASADVYRRHAASVAPSMLAALAGACGRSDTVVAVTSVEGLVSLIELAPEDRVPGLRDTALLVPGDRVAAAARDHGWRGRVIVAPSAEDASMLATLESAFGQP
jgi:uroporphyrinogen-III synthase